MTRKQNLRQTKRKTNVLIMAKGHEAICSAILCKLVRFLSLFAGEGGARCAAFSRSLGVLSLSACSARRCAESRRLAGNTSALPIDKAAVSNQTKGKN